LELEPTPLSFGSLPNGEETRVITATNTSDVPLSLTAELGSVTGPGSMYTRRASSCVELGEAGLAPGASCTYAVAAYFDAGAPAGATLAGVLRVTVRTTVGREVVVEAPMSARRP
jgi:hypothetical protein